MVPKLTLQHIYICLSLSPYRSRPCPSCCWKELDNDRYIAWLVSSQIELESPRCHIAESFRIIYVISNRRYCITEIVLELFVGRKFWRLGAYGRINCWRHNVISISQTSKTNQFVIVPGQTAIWIMTTLTLTPPSYQNHDCTTVALDGVDISCKNQRFRKGVGRRGLATNGAQNTAKSVPQNCVLLLIRGRGAKEKRGQQKGLNLWRGSDFLAPTPSLHQPLFETSRKRAWKDPRLLLKRRPKP